MRGRRTRGGRRGGQDGEDEKRMGSRRGRGEGEEGEKVYDRQIGRRNGVCLRASDRTLPVKGIGRTRS